MDEALGLPTESAVRLALRTQQILASETGVADTIDPLAGSYAVESLTDAIEARAEAYLASIDAMGGALAAIEKGYVQREIHEAAYRAQRDIESGAALVVGVNAFADAEPLRLERLRVDPDVERRQRLHLAEVRRRRDGRRVAELLDRLTTAAEGRENLLPMLLECVESDVTLGEICGRLRQVWGEYRPAGAI
jgi:methylmalonyl-CoA mutase N-terminal domain/subunit